MIKIYVDGSVKDNGTEKSIGGYGVIVFNDENKMLQAYHEKQSPATNNQMELKALLYALELTQTKYKNEECIIYSDSIYCVKIWNEWISIWANNNWKRKGNKNIINLDLIRSIYNYFTIDFIHCQVKVEHCNGHKGIIGNELADAAATFNYTKFLKIIEDNSIQVDYINKI